MIVKIVRVLFVAACIILGLTWARLILGNLEEAGQVIQNRLMWTCLGGFAGALISGAVLILLFFVTQEMYERVAPSVVAVVLALIAGYSVSRYMLFWLPDLEVTYQLFISVTIVLVFGYIGIYLGLTRASNWTALVSAVRTRNIQSSTPVSLKLVDTSVLIDGRIADICLSGFIEGTLLIPRFVLKELQNIADCSDIIRRAKGRRGLDILKALQESAYPVGVSIIEDNPGNSREVDEKLVLLAKQYNARIFTTDFNLNKVAQIEGVVVMNINDLANALKPAVLPDETMEIKLIKEGKEPTQAVGYLDDGTMVVVDNGRGYLGRSVQVLVTSVLQTSAGRMIFARFNGISK
ncbi:MAG: PIN/TRAM domain-containing protein [Candidatus Hydrogenedentales bacterium]|jgi:uncharacterized protein YacL